MKKVTMICCTIIFCFFCPLFVNNVLSWDNEKTHRDLSEIAANNSVMSKIKDDYLKRIGLEYGLEEYLQLGDSNKKIIKWLSEGAFFEDAGEWWNAVGIGSTARYMNHFHNPLKPWEQAGLADLQSGESALLWAQDTTKQSTALADDQTWQTIRNYFYGALTSKMDGERQVYFAQTFKGLGHQMHLIQDMAVPSHVRNDAHPGDAISGMNYITGDLYFETYAKIVPDMIKNLASNPVFPQVDLTNNPGDMIPITQFYDTDQYNENVVPTKSLSWGISEYTNANFLSDDTVFTEMFSKSDKHYFPYPRYIYYSQCYERYEEASISGKARNYWRKKCGGEPVEHFVYEGVFFKYAFTWDLQRLSINLDERTHKDYAEKLVPRAVGYSAGLLNYFFRGDIRLEYTTSPKPGYVIINKTAEDMDGLFQLFYDNQNDQRVEFMSGNFGIKANNKGDIFDITPPADAKDPGKFILVFKGNMGNEKGAVAGYVTSRRLEITPPDQFIYSMADAGESTPQFKDIKVKVRNAGSEIMQNGTLQAIAKYKKTTDDPDYLYAISAFKSGISLTSTPLEFSFDFTGSPIPVDVTDLYLEIAYKGTIGSEANAMASGIKDISEPTPIDLFSNTDKSCLNGTWYVSGSQEAIAQVDKDADGNANDWNEEDIYPHILKNIYIKISSPANPINASPTVNNFIVPELDAGQFKRAMYILTDKQFKYSFNTTWERKDTDDLWGHSIMTYLHSGTAVKNQTDYTSDPAICGTDALCYIYSYPEYYAIRGNDMWWGGGVVFINSPYPANSSCQGY